MHIQTACDIIEGKIAADEALVKMAWDCLIQEGIESLYERPSTIASVRFGAPLVTKD